MSWNASASGDYHHVVDALRDLNVTGDQKAVELGHVETAKDMALAALDSEKGYGVVFGVSLSGHTTDKETYSVNANVSVSRK